MGQKDIAAKELEWLNVIFADIANAFFAINGIENCVVNPEDLQDTRTRTSYRADGTLRDQERDVAKFWLSPDGSAELCLMGLENQSNVDTYMPLRVFGYEGADYRQQLIHRKTGGLRRGKRPYFVITIVLYFGTHRRWPKRRSLHERLNVPARFRGLVTDCRLNILELAWLSDEEEALFKSDFRHIVHYLRQVRMNREHIEMLPGTIDHAPELLALLGALTGDRRFQDAIAQAQIMQEKGEPITLTSFLEQAEQRGRSQGIDIGRSQGIDIGRSQGIDIGRSQERQLIRDRLVAAGMAPQDATRYTGLSD
ncbi:MAG: Rpn family recombination-promoting nuclease/putative transposase [Fretibacterium sp.]|nr:Rpn family recombination-promoting nuclease/putative transposase [Fretibacterium sp.]